MKQAAMRLQELRELVQERALTLEERQEYERLVRLEGPCGLSESIGNEEIVMQPVYRYDVHTS